MPAEPVKSQPPNDQGKAASVVPTADGSKLASWTYWTYWTYWTLVGSTIGLLLYFGWLA